jgi:hypothetical protein
LEILLKNYVNQDQWNWDKVLPFVLYVYRTAIHSTSGVSPHFILIGRDCKTPLDLCLGMSDDDDEEVRNRVETRDIEYTTQSLSTNIATKMDMMLGSRRKKYIDQGTRFSYTHRQSLSTPQPS